MTAQQITVDTPAILRAVFYPAGSETGTDDDPVTVAVTRADGTAVSGVGAVASPGNGVYTATLPAQTTLDVLTATWTGATSKVRTTHEIVGANLVELAEIRAQTNLSSTSSYPTALLEEARAWFVDLVSDFCCFSPVPRFAQETVDGNGGSRLGLTTRPYIRRLRYATIDGAAVDTAVLAKWGLADGILDAAGTSFPAGRSNVTVAYEYGLDRPDADLRRAALTAIRNRILTDTNQQLPDRVISQTNDFGSVQYTQASGNYPTGIPDVDSTLIRERLVTVA